MNYSFLALQDSPPSMHPRGLIYSPPMDNGGSSQSVFQAYGRPRVKFFGTHSGKLQKFFLFCTFHDVHGLQWSNLGVHVGISLKVMYKNK